MKPIHLAGLRFLRSSILVALGLSPIAACKGTITLDCSNAKPGDNGLVDCGLIQVRPDPTKCTLPGPGDQSACSQYAECQSDSDCTAAANGRCNMNPGYGDCGCTYGCQTDADCGYEEACLCTDEGGACVLAHCQTSADCEDGQSCALYDYAEACTNYFVSAFACTTTHDECLSDSQCQQGYDCVFGVDHFACQSMVCQEGRPFYVQGELRTAPLVRSLDWASPLRPAVAALGPAEREAAAQRWARIGQLEHASVASFARFALQLLSLGAPPELVEQTTSAMADETLHARLAFGLASAYSGSPVGPGPLHVGGALESNDVAAIVSALVHEGCVGETLAAALAREERERTADPVVRGVLDRIVADEERHALLAWRALGWLVERRGGAAEAAATLAAEMRGLAAELRAPGSAPLAFIEDADTDVAGALSTSEMASLRAAVLETVVLPSARALLERAATGDLCARRTKKARNVEDGVPSATDSAPPSGAPPTLSGPRPPSGCPREFADLAFS